MPMPATLAVSFVTHPAPQDHAARPTFEAIISRLRRMLAAEASVRRESPTKSPPIAAQPSMLSVGSLAAGSSYGGGGGLALDIVSGGGQGDETPGGHSHVASLATASELGASPDHPRCAVGLASENGLQSASPSALAGAGLLGVADAGPAGPLGSQRQHSGDSSAGALRTLSSITSGDGEEPEAPGTAGEAAAAADVSSSIAAGRSRQPAG